MAFPSRLRLATFSLLALVAAFGPAPVRPAAIDSAQPRVIVVLWDGAQRNHFLELYNTGQLPNLQALVQDGGLLRTDLVIHSETCLAGSGDGYRTETGPANSAILTGYGYPDQGNQFNSDPGPIPAGCTFYERLKATGSNAKTGIITSKHQPFWPTLPLSNAPSSIFYWFQGAAPQETLTDLAIHFLTQYAKAPFFLYLHYAQPDATGHGFGENSPEYSQALLSDDTELGRVLDHLTLLGIRQYTRILVTTDHGFQEGGFEHQACIDDTRNLWIAADRAELISRPGVDAYQTSIGPTLFDIYGMDKNVSPRFPAQSLYDDGKPPIPLLYPIDDPAGSGSYRVEWSTTPAAESYTLEESGTPDFAAPLPRYTGPDPAFEVTDQPPGTWYYRVLASNGAGDSPWSNVQSVAVVPGAPTLLPVENPGGGAGYLVDWEDVTGAVTYTLEEDSSVAFPFPAVRYAGPGTEFQVTGQSPGTWYYRVLASNGAGDGPWSNVQSVAVVPGAPTLLPIDNPGGGARYLVDWEDVTGAITYTLEEDASVGFPLPAVRYAGPGTEFQVIGQSPGTWYYRVGASNELGRSPWSGTAWTAVAARVYLPIVQQDR